MYNVLNASRYSTVLMTRGDIGDQIGIAAVICFHPFGMVAVRASMTWAGSAGSLASLSDHIAILKLNHQRCADYFLSRYVCLFDPLFVCSAIAPGAIPSGGPCQATPGAKIAWLARAMGGALIRSKIDRYDP
jgi:hypothetical protein